MYPKMQVKRKYTTTMTFTVLIVSIEQNEEFQESRDHYTLAGIKSLLKIGAQGFLGARGGFRNPWNPTLAYAPVFVSGVALFLMDCYTYNICMSLGYRDCLQLYDWLAHLNKLFTLNLVAV